MIDLASLLSYQISNLSSSIRINLKNDWQILGCSQLPGLPSPPLATCNCKPGFQLATNMGCPSNSEEDNDAVMRECVFQ